MQNYIAELYSLNSFSRELYPLAFSSGEGGPHARAVDEEDEVCTQ